MRSASSFVSATIILTPPIVNAFHTIKRLKLSAINVECIPLMGGAKSGLAMHMAILFLLPMSCCGGFEPKNIQRYINSFGSLARTFSVALSAEK